MKDESSMESYRSITSFLIGSRYITLSHQDYSHVYDTEQRITGKDDYFGVGGEKFVCQDPPLFNDLKFLPLGHPLSIMFWTRQQDRLYRIIEKDDSHTLLGGNYGCGKTSLLVSCALSSEDDDGAVIFISAASYGPKYECTLSVRYILDVATALKFENTSVKFLSLVDIREELKMDVDTDINTLIKLFLHKKDNIKKMFIDEYPVSQEDIKDINKNQESELAKTLGMISEKCSKSVIALRTTDLLDHKYTGKENASSVPLSTLHDHLEIYTPYNIVVMDKTMRTTSSIAKCARDTKKYSSDIFLSSVSVVSVLPLGECSTVPGPTPYCISSFWGSDELTAISNSLRYYLGTILQLSGTIKTRIAIICDSNISPRQIVTGISPPYPVMVYTAGVESYTVNGVASLDPGDDYDSAKELEDITSWLHNGGILLTLCELFSGMEANTVVWVTSDMGMNTHGRSSASRATNKMCVVTNCNVTKMEEVRRDFNDILLDLKGNIVTESDYYESYD